MAVAGKKVVTFEKRARNFWLSINRWLVLGICLLVLGGCQLQGRPDDSGAIAALQFWRNLIEDGSAVLSLPERAICP